MSLLKQIEDKGAVLEWSPVLSYPNLVALGTKDSAGVGFDDFGGELELYLLDFSDSNDLSTSLLGKARANSRFSSIAWSQMAINSGEYPYGLVAGGMVDGNIHVWDPARLAAGDPESLLASVEQHQGPINGLHFNPHKESSHLLASGGSDCEVYVTSIERPEQPNVFVPAPPPNNAKHSAEITKVAWNTQVAHILASASQNGSCFIWDLRQKRAWCELRDPSGGCVSDVAWNPDQGLHLVTASGEDKNPVLKLWDLRSSTSLPLATLQGHTEGILSISWCPTDPSLLLSCAKDNKTILWDLFHLQPVYELPSAQTPYQSDGSSVSSPLEQQNVFGGFASSAGSRRHHVSWSPCLPGVISASSFDRKVQFFSLTGARSKIGRAPKWLRRPIGATFGFGGKLVSFDGLNAASSTATGGKRGAGSVQLKVHQVVEDPELVAASDIFHDVIAKGDFKQFCELKADSSSSQQERQVWGLMKVICFCANAREELLTHLGFDSTSISAAAEEYVRQTSDSKKSSELASSAQDVFGEVSSTPSAAPSLDLTSLPPSIANSTAEMVVSAMAGEKAEPMIRKAIIVGNFEAAVECCLQAGLMAEALLLAQCGEQSLRIKTQAAFFEKQRNKHPFLNVLHAVIKSELMAYVEQSDLSRWKETLALLSTYGKSDEFPLLCEALAGRLETELGDVNSATLCFMCAANVSRTVGFWTQELVQANAARGQLDTVALQQYVEKVSVFTHANPVDNLGPDCTMFFAAYANLLANQGRLEIALSYLKGENIAEKILIDRLYHAGNKKAGSRPPPFPFTKSVVETTAVAAASGNKAGVQKGNTAGGKAAIPAVGEAAARSAPVKSTPTAQQNVAVAQRVETSKQSAAAAPLGTSTDAQGLPAGWIQLIDPGSGHPYYVNQSSGVSQWEPPVPSVAIEPQKPQQNFQQQQQQQQQPFQQQQQFQPQVVNTSVAPVVSSFPAATTQVATADHASVGPSAAAKADVSAPTVVDASCVAEFGQLIEALAASIVVTAEKRQLDMVNTAYTNLREKAAANQLGAEVMLKLAKFVECMVARNYAGATAIQTDLVNTVWGQHKEWLKGLKILVQLASKK